MYSCTCIQDVCSTITKPIYIKLITCYVMYIHVSPIVALMLVLTTYNGTSLLWTPLGPAYVSSL